MYSTYHGFPMDSVRIPMGNHGYPCLNIHANMDSSTWKSYNLKFKGVSINPTALFKMY